MTNSQQTGDYAGTAVLVEAQEWLQMMIARDFDDAGARFNATLHNSDRSFEKDIAQHVLMSVALKRLRTAGTLRRMAVHLTTCDFDDGIAFLLSHRSFDSPEDVRSCIQSAPPASSSRHRTSLVRLVEAMGGWLRASPIHNDEVHVLWLPQLGAAKKARRRSSDEATALW